MSNKQLPAGVQDRIELDAEDYANKHMNGRVNTHEYSVVAAGYIAGATAEAERAQGLMDALEDVVNEYEYTKPNYPWWVKQAKHAIRQWKEGKEVDNG